MEASGANAIPRGVDGGGRPGVTQGQGWCVWEWQGGSSSRERAEKVSCRVRGPMNAL